MKYKELYGWFSVKCIDIHVPDYAVPGQGVRIGVTLEGVAPPFFKVEARAILVDADTEEQIAIGKPVGLKDGERYTWEFNIVMPEKDFRVYGIGQAKDPILGWRDKCKTRVATIKKVTTGEAVAYKVGELILVGSIGAGVGYAIGHALEKDPIAFAIGGAATAIGVDLVVRGRTLLG